MADLYLNIPNIKTRGYGCAQACLQSLHQYYCPEDRLTTNQINEITLRHNKRTITWVLQFCYGLSQLGYSFRYYVKPNFKQLCVSKLREQREHLFSNCNFVDLTDWNALETAHRFIVNKQVFIEAMSFDILQVIRSSLLQESICVVLVKAKELLPMEVRSSMTDTLHYVIISGISVKAVFVNNSGPFQYETLKSIEFPEFLSAWFQNLVDWGCVVVNPPHSSGGPV